MRGRCVRSLLVLPLLASMVIVGSAQKASGPAPKAGPSPARSSAGFDTVVKPFLAQNCFSCHGNKKQENDLNLQSFDTRASLIAHREQWDEVVGKLRRGEMPPLEEEQPPEEQRQAVAAWLARELERIDAATPPDPGRVTARRLNRTEYNNTIKELLGVDLRPADDFPQDDAGYGFDNIADVLSLSPVLMEKYVSAADRVARVAVFGPPPMEPTLARLRSEGRRVVDQVKVPATYDVTGLSLPNAFHAMHRIPVDGEYVVRVVLGGLRPKASEPITIALWVDEKLVQTATHDQERAASFADDRQDFGGQAVQMKVRLTAGDHWISVAIPRIYEGLPVRYAGPNPSTRPDPPREFKPPANVPPERLEQLRKRFDDATAELAKIALNGVRVNVVEIGGPYSYTKGPSRASLEKIYTCGHLNGQHQPTCMPRVVTGLARRAFRRPVTTREVEKYVALAESAQKQEGSFEEGLAVGIQAILVSPDFLFRIERDRPGRTSSAGQRGHRRLSPHASRAGDAAVVFPLGEHARCRAAQGGRHGHAARPAGPCVPGPADAAGSEISCAGGELRRPMAAVPRPRVVDPRPRQVPGVRRLPAAVDAPGNGALHRIDRQERPQRARLHQRALLVPERAPGAALRHPQRVGTGVPPGRPVGDAARRRADPGQHPRRLLVRHEDLAGASRQVGARQPAQCATARAASRRPEPRRSHHRHVGVDARAARGTSQERDLRLVSPSHGSARFRSRELRRRRRVARRGGQVPDRRVRPAARRPPFHRPRGAAEDSL